ncbi:MAG TPA: hypothetical protein PKY30_16805, partial [Myxococcota bacterium]|nr:hypothetical protein [Myxococcota bacterium]
TEPPIRIGGEAAFLIGHLGFWIEKVPLSIPGGLPLVWPPAIYRAVSREELEKVRAQNTKA